MRASSSTRRFRAVILILAWACIATAAAWALRWAFETRVLEGRLRPEDAMAGMAAVWTALWAGCAAVSATLAGLLARIARQTIDRRLWPPSGSWPPARALDADEARTLALWLRLAALTCGLIAASAAWVAIG